MLNRSMLLLDDSEAVLAVMLPALRPHATNVEAHLVREATARELLDHLAVHDPDIVLVDGQMPHFHGDALVPLLRERWPRAACIGFSAAPSYERKFLNAGAQGFVYKDIDDAAATVERLLRTLAEIGDRTSRR